MADVILTMQDGTTKEYKDATVRTSVASGNVIVTANGKDIEWRGSDVRAVQVVDDKAKR